MGIKEEIFEEFFLKLKKDKEFPNAIVKGLKELWKSGEIASQEKILTVIQGGCADVGED